MKLILASDHAGFATKQILLNFLKLRADLTVEDGGTFNEGSCHYPEYAIAASERVAKGDFDFGILLCGSGIGVSIASNKVKGARCALGYHDEATKRARIDNNANILAFGARYMTIDEMKHRIDLFLTTPFEGGRHQVRLDIIADYEAENFK